MKVKEESKKAGLKLNTQKTKIMASYPITSWQIDGQTVETVADFILGGSKITADGDCGHEIKRHLLLGRIPTSRHNYYFLLLSSHSVVSDSCDLIDCSTPGFPVLYHFLEFAQIHVH